MDKRKKYLITIIIVLIGIVAIVGGVYAYNSYMNQKFDDNFKLQYQTGDNAKIYFNDASSDTKTYNNEQDWAAATNNSISSFKKAMGYLNQSINYEQEMVKYAPDKTHKTYAEALVNMNKESMKMDELYLQYYGLFVWPGTVTNQTKANQLLTDINTTQQNIETLNNQKDQIKLLNPDLNDQINNLTKEASTAIT